MVGPNALSSNTSTARALFCICLVVTLAYSFGSVASAQTKPERQSKAAKPVSANQPTTLAAAAAPNSEDESEPAKPEEKAFKGMHYRMIGPFRGGRSLTAAGIPEIGRASCRERV